MGAVVAWAMLSLGCGDHAGGGRSGDGGLDAAGDALVQGADARADSSVETKDSGGQDAGDHVCPDPGGTFAVQAVLGQVANGQTLVVCGDQFGDQGPDLVLFDDFEQGLVGERVADSTPLIGAWLGGNALYVDDMARSGDQAFLAADADVNDGHGLQLIFGVSDPNGRFGLREFDEFFMAWSIRDLGDFPGNDSSPTQFSSDSSAKDIWVMFGDRGDNYDWSCSQGECNGNDVVLATHSGRGSFKIDGNTTRSSWWLPDFWEFQQWNTMHVYLKIDPDRPYEASTGIFEHVSMGLGYLRDEYDGQILQDLDGLIPVWDRAKLAAWYRTAGDVRRIFDDVYLAIGPGAAARIEIGNAPDIQDVTKLAVSTVTSWSNGRIEFTVRLGDLDPNVDDLYLFVVRADHERSSGYHLVP